MSGCDTPAQRGRFNHKIEITRSPIAGCGFLFPLLVAPIRLCRLTGGGTVSAQSQKKFEISEKIAPKESVIGSVKLAFKEAIVSKFSLDGPSARLDFDSTLSM